MIGSVRVVKGRRDGRVQKKKNPLQASCHGRIVSATVERRQGRRATNSAEMRGRGRDGAGYSCAEEGVGEHRGVFLKGEEEEAEEDEEEEEA